MVTSPSEHQAFMTKKTSISLLVGTAFSCSGLYLAFRNVPFGSLWEYAQQVNYWWTLPAAGSLALAYFIRSLRWQWLLIPSGRPLLSSAYHSLIISMMINCLLPGRVGELARPVVLQKLEGLPLASSFAALGVERLLDLVALLILLLPTLMLMAPDADTVVTFGRHQLSRRLLVDLGYFSLLTAILLVLLAYAFGRDRLRQRFAAWIHRLPEVANLIGFKKLAGVLQSFEGHVQNFIERGARGVKAICHWKGFLVGMLTSLIFWGFSALSFLFLSIGSPHLDLSFINICGVMVIICFFIALPSVPGFWGLWEAAGVFALSLIGVADDVAAGFSLFSHAFNLIPVIAAGWLSCLALGFRWRTLAKRDDPEPIAH
jgi:uncharacterized protein (TIRG00374 family)